MEFLFGTPSKQHVGTNLDGSTDTKITATSTADESLSGKDKDVLIARTTSPFLAPVVSSNPGTAPTVAPEPTAVGTTGPVHRMSATSTDSTVFSCFEDAQQGFLDPQNTFSRSSCGKQHQHHPTTPKTLFSSSCSSSTSSKSSIGESTPSQTVNSDSSTDDLPKMMMMAAVWSPPPPAPRSFREKHRRRTTSRSSRRSHSSSSSLSQSLLLDGYDEAVSSKNMKSPLAVRRRSSHRDVRRSTSSGGPAPTTNRQMSSPAIISPDVFVRASSGSSSNNNNLYSSPEMSSESSPDSSPNRSAAGMNRVQREQHRRVSSSKLEQHQQHPRYHMKQASFSSARRQSGNHSDPSLNGTQLNSSTASSTNSFLSKSNSINGSNHNTNNNNNFIHKKLKWSKSWCLTGTFMCMVAISLSGMILLTNQAAIHDSFDLEHSINRPDTFHSAAGLRGKMVQGRWEDKPHIGNSHVVKSKTTLTSKSKPKTTQKISSSTAAKQKVSSTSSTSAIKKAKKLDDENEREEKQVKSASATTSSKLHYSSSQPRGSSKTKSTGTSSPQPSTILPAQFEMHIPPPLTLPKAKFEKVDPNLYARSTSTKKIQGKSSSSTKEEESDHNQHPRVVVLDLSVSQVARKIKVYPADFTDNTQLYGILPSDDERLSHMEIRAPYSEGECIPMQDWQTTFHPSCNGMHELALQRIGAGSSDMEKEDSKDNKGSNKVKDPYRGGLMAQLFGTKGFWRYAWKLDLEHYDNQGHAAADKDSVVLKTLKYEHNFEDAHFEHDRVDAVAMERLTASPHVINVFGFCGHSVLTEYADGSRVGELADKARKTPLERLRIASDIAHGLADVHGIDGDGNATFVHLDVNPANVVSIGGTLKLNDFNIGIIRRWNTTSNEPCGFPAQYPNPQWRSPEEARNEQNLTEKVDIFSMGHIFFRLICGHEPWNKLEPGGKPTKDEINRKVQRGDLPFIPDYVKNSENPEVIAIRDAMLSCYKLNPKERPSARDIAKTLDQKLEEFSKNAAFLSDESTVETS